jgi:hypothetical protein
MEEQQQQQQERMLQNQQEAEELRKEFLRKYKERLAKEERIKRDLEQEQHQKEEQLHQEREAKLATLLEVKTIQINRVELINIPEREGESGRENESIAIGTHSKAEAS